MRDWISDVCASDLASAKRRARSAVTGCCWSGTSNSHAISKCRFSPTTTATRSIWANASARRKIGRASCREKCVSTCRSRWSPSHYKKKQKNKTRVCKIKQEAKHKYLQENKR